MDDAPCRPRKPALSNNNSATTEIYVHKLGLVAGGGVERAKGGLQCLLDNRKSWAF